MKKVQYIEMDYDELDDIIRDIYSAPEYEFCLDQEARNDSEYACSLDGNIYDTDDDDINEFIENGSGSQLWHRLLEDLAYFGIIEEADYLIRVCW